MQFEWSVTDIALSDVSFSRPAVSTIPLSEISVSVYESRFGCWFCCCCSVVSVVSLLLSLLLLLLLSCYSVEFSLSLLPLQLALPCCICCFLATSPNLFWCSASDGFDWPAPDRMELEA